MNPPDLSAYISVFHNGAEDTHILYSIYTHVVFLF